MAEKVTIIQSYRTESVPAWITQCMTSVQDCAVAQGAAYNCYDDEAILSLLSDSFKDKVGERWPMLTDLARLLLVRQCFNEGYDRVIWLDADVYLWNVQNFDLTVKLPNGFGFGRERWTEESGKIRNGVHNAICIFDKGNPFLDYYILACESIIEKHRGEYLAPQLLGPKFLKSQLPFMGDCLVDFVEMWSPAVIKDLLEGEGEMLARQREGIVSGIGANLCHSLSSPESIDKLLPLLET